MRYSFIYSVFIAFILIITATPASAVQKVVVIPVSGNVDPGMASYLKRALSGPGDEAPLFILELDTFGGRVDSALQIVDTLLNIPKGKTVAFVTHKAISAGALIALACNELVMKPHTTIGDCAPISYAKDGPQMMGEKFQSPLRAKFRSLAKRNGYSEVLAESMVTKEIAVYRVEMDGRAVYMNAHQFDELGDAEKEKISSKKTVVAEGELLTMDAAEALELGFSKMTAADLSELLTGMGIEDYDLVRIEQSWSETLVSMVSTAAPILMMIGLAALYIEIKSPGFGLPGLIGIGCLGLVFFGQYLVGMADYSELLLLIAGVLLLGVEVFVLPGFGIAGVAGILFITAGMILALQDFVLPSPELPWQAELLTRNIAQVLGAGVAAFVISMLFFRYLLPRMGTLIEGPYLSATLKSAHADSKEAELARIGDSGMALTFLRPAGKVEIRGERLDAVSEAEFIEKGTPVIVSGIEGNRIIVSRKTQP